MNITSPDEFDKGTALMLDVLFEDVANEDSHQSQEFRKLPASDRDWFQKYCDKWVRYFHANDPKWRTWLEGRNPRIDQRAQVKVWFRHWLAGYVINPDRYHQQAKMLGLPTKEK
jgi:hypothetical protein